MFVEKNHIDQLDQMNLTRCFFISSLDPIEQISLNSEIGVCSWRDFRKNFRFSLTELDLHLEVQNCNSDMQNSVSHFVFFEIFHALGETFDRLRSKNGHPLNKPQFN